MKLVCVQQKQVQLILLNDSRNKLYVGNNISNGEKYECLLRKGTRSI